ncbi:MAG: NAD kinase [Defluviitaleaceae bacterium]|nr:NAD kinase [Defluviitaleaceae bacterium]
MKFTVFTYDSERNSRIKQKLEQKLMKENFMVDPHDPDLVFTIGGDGTVLRAIHSYLDAGKLNKVKFIGIHTGHLGYYTDWLPEELDELILFLTTYELQNYRYPLLEAKLCAGEKTRYRYALNEFTILNAKRTQHLDITINDMFLESFRGTGVCVSSPTGSTAYNKALGGALIYPSLPIYQLTEIASINSNAYRTIGSPLIIPKEQKLILESENWEGMTLTQDHLALDISQLTAIHMTLSDQHVQFVKRKDGLFWNRVKDHFL